jgi:hypothetical protein
MDMTTTSGLRGVAVEPHPNIKMPCKPQMRKAERAARKNAATRSSWNAQRKYERYLALARAEALKGDHISAENYLQHAEHYLRSIRENSVTASGVGRS